MSRIPDDFVQQVHQDTLNKIIIPKLKTQTTGVDYLVLQKELLLAFAVNDLLQVPHITDQPASTAVTGPGLTFASPINAKRIIFSMRFTYTATATVGTRTPAVQKEAKSGAIFNKYVVDSATASQIRTYEFGPGVIVAGAVNVALNFPITLQKEDLIRIDDTSNIDNADTIVWVIDYVEIPL